VEEDAFVSKEQISGGPGGVRVRAGGSPDAAAVLGLFDDAVRWLVRQGRTGQWGTEPFSERPRMVERVHRWAAGGGLRVAEIDARPVGAIALGEALEYAPPAPEPELYIQGFVTDSRCRGQGIGDALLAVARNETIRRGVRLLRVDCWGGGDRALVRYYERAGFTAAERVPVGDTEVQILHQRF
jgi:GNAT superfamily N-acetyltransferase